MINFIQPGSERQLLATIYDLGFWRQGFIPQPRGNNKSTLRTLAQGSGRGRMPASDTLHSGRLYSVESPQGKHYR